MTNTDNQPETLPPGLYFIGDPTYLGLSEKDFNQVWWGEDGVLTSEGGEQFAKFRIGADGVYGDNDGFEYGVDSASIGAYPITSVDEVDTALGRCVEFSEEVTVAFDEELGLVRFGEIEILLVNVALLGEPLTRPEGMSDLDWLRERAKAEDSEAQYELYEELEGDPETHREAIKWMFAAARGGNAIAQYDAGYLREYGEGHQKNYREAVKWYRLSAEQGDEIAQEALGACYHFGNGVELDYEGAVKWYRAAAEQGWGLAQWSLGNCYYDGDGVEQDFEEAVKWYRLSAEQGCSLGQEALGKCYYFGGDGVELDYEEAVKWLRPAAEDDLSRAQGILGTLYEFGDGVEQSDEKAIYWYERAAKNGDELATLDAAGFYIGFERDPAAEKNIHRGFTLLLKILGRLDAEYFAIKGCYDAFIDAANEFLVTEAGDEEPDEDLFLPEDANFDDLAAFCYEHGLGVEKDVERAENIRNYGLG
jgi:TPR repeat protein